MSLIHVPMEARRALILVVDDQLPNVQLVGSLLSGAGFDVMPALSGEQAFARLQAKLPDLVLMDMMMPDRDGFAVTEEIRANPRYAAIPIIFLTAAHDRDLLVRAFAAGAVDYVTKPFVADELLARVRTHVELKRTRDHLHLVAGECGSLTQIVAHDLKSPLSNIQFSAQLLVPALRRDPERATALIESIGESAELALRFIERYLGRCADGELKRRFELIEIDLKALCQLSFSNLKAQADSSGINFQLSTDPNARAVWADELATRHVLQNLLSNAIRYAPVSGTIEVHIGRGNPGMTRVSVLDRGPGISTEAQSRLFRRYVRLDSSQTSQPNSTGLGLAISKQEVTQMDGHLWYNDREGGGAAFCFELPIAPSGG